MIRNNAIMAIVPLAMMVRGTKNASHNSDLRRVMYCNNTAICLNLTRINQKYMNKMNKTCTQQCKPLWRPTFALRSWMVNGWGTTSEFAKAQLFGSGETGGSVELHLLEGSWKWQPRRFRVRNAECFQGDWSFQGHSASFDLLHDPLGFTFLKIARDSTPEKVTQANMAKSVKLDKISWLECSKSVFPNVAGFSSFLLQLILFLLHKKWDCVENFLPTRWAVSKGERFWTVPWPWDQRSSTATAMSLLLWKMPQSSDGIKDLVHKLDEKNVDIQWNKNGSCLPSVSRKGIANAPKHQTSSARDSQALGKKAPAWVTFPSGHTAFIILTRQ